MCERMEQFERFTTAVTRAHKCIQKAKKAETERMGLKGRQVMCLYYLGKSAGGLTAAELCQLCHEDKAAISRTLVDLTEMGLIAPCADPKRKYREKLTLTAQGRDKDVQMREAIERAVRGASVGFGEAERACFYRVLFTIIDNLEKLYAP